MNEQIEMLISYSGTAEELMGMLRTGFITDVITEEQAGVFRVTGSKKRLGTRSTVTEEMHEEIRELRKNGVPVSDIAEKYNISQSHMYALLRGAEKPKKKKKVVKADIRQLRNERIYKDHLNGLSVAELAHKNKVSVSTIEHILASYNRGDIEIRNNEF